MPPRQLIACCPPSTLSHVPPLSSYLLAIFGPPLATACLDNPPELARLVAGRLPRLSEELMVVGVGAALYYNLRLIGALGVGSIEAERGDNDQVATDFDAKLVTPTRHA
jgi:hypothetical protein